MFNRVMKTRCQTLRSHVDSGSACNAFITIHTAVCCCNVETQCLSLFIHNYPPRVPCQSTSPCSPKSRQQINGAIYHPVIIASLTRLLIPLFSHIVRYLSTPSQRRMHNKSTTRVPVFDVTVGIQSGEALYRVKQLPTSARMRA